MVVYPPAKLITVYVSSTKEETGIQITVKYLFKK